MKKLILIMALFALPGTTLATSGQVELLDADTDLGDVDSLQRGARIFVNYCLSCHSAAYSRFSRVAKDLKLTDEQMEDNLMFTTDKIGSTMKVAMRGADAEQWFGKAPPDLSVIARSRGADWLYTFLNGFYLDEERPTGVNNVIFTDTAMPHVLWDLQGWQRLGHEGEHGPQIKDLELAVPGKLPEEEYRSTVRDLVNYLTYMSEPAKLIRSKMGPWVILFLVFFLVIAYQLKKEFWKDLH